MTQNDKFLVENLKNFWICKAINVLCVSLFDLAYVYRNRESLSHSSCLEDASDRTVSIQLYQESILVVDPRKWTGGDGVCTNMVEVYTTHGYVFVPSKPRGQTKRLEDSPVGVLLSLRRPRKFSRKYFSGYMFLRSTKGVVLPQSPPYDLWVLKPL